MQYRIATNVQRYTIHDKPDTREPIRRLQLEGPDVLSVGELVRVALGPIEGLDDSLRKYGIASLIHARTASELASHFKLDHLQATRLLAMLGLGRKLFLPEQGGLLTVRGIDDVVQHYHYMASLPKEQLRVLLISSRYQVVHEEVIAIGGVDTLQIAARDVFQAAVERRVSAIILLHNHPSGDPDPSAEDIEFTQRMQEAGSLLGIELLDHVIIAQRGFRSCSSS